MRVLAIVHQLDAGPGVFAEAIRERGARLDCWAVAGGGPPPGPPARYDAVLTFGGAAHADQELAHPWLAAEKALLAELLDRGVPLLGVCLGAQLLAEAAGGLARRASAPEIGWYEVVTTAEAAADPLLAPLAPSFEALEWHSYEFTLPPGATALAHSSICIQAYRLEDAAAWGIQFHAEVTEPDYQSWLADLDGDESAVALGVDADELRGLTGTRIGPWNQLGRDLCARFLDAASDVTRARVATARASGTRS